MALKWNTSIENYNILKKIVERLKDKQFDLTISDSIMDLEACHANDMELDFQMLLDFDLCDFLHDIYGISYHIDRSTGKLQNCFVPRCAKKQYAEIDAKVLLDTIDNREEPWHGVPYPVIEPIKLSKELEDSLDWTKDNNICPECGGKLEYYIAEEEMFEAFKCNKCSYYTEV